MKAKSSKVKNSLSPYFEVDLQSTRAASKRLSRWSGRRLRLVVRVGSIKIKKIPGGSGIYSLMPATDYTSPTEAPCLLIRLNWSKLLLIIGITEISWGCISKNYLVTFDSEKSETCCSQLKSKEFHIYYLVLWGFSWLQTRNREFIFLVHWPFFLFYLKS